MRHPYSMAIAAAKTKKQKECGRYKDQEGLKVKRERKRVVNRMGGRAVRVDACQTSRHSARRSRYSSKVSELNSKATQ